MAFAAPLVAAAQTGIAAIGGASTLSAIGTGIGIIGSLRQANYQKAIADNQAQLMQQQAEQTRRRGEIEQQETDFAALREMGANEARRAGTGFSLGSTSFNRSRRLEGILARRDALRIRDNAEREALGLQNRAESARLEGKLTKQAGIFNAVGGAFTLGGDLISGATLANKRKAAELGLTAP